MRLMKVKPSSNHRLSSVCPHDDPPLIRLRTRLTNPRDTANLPILPDQIDHAKPFDAPHPEAASPFQQQAVKDSPWDRQRERGSPVGSGDGGKFGRQGRTIRRDNRHAPQAPRPGRAYEVKQIELIEESDGSRAEIITADLLAREGCLVEQQRLNSTLRQEAGQDRAGRTGAHNNYRGLWHNVSLLRCLG